MPSKGSGLAGLALVLALALCACGGSQATSAKPTLALFATEVKHLKIDAAQLRALDEHVAALLEGQQTYELVPRDDLRRALLRRGRPRPCGEAECQVRIGRKLDAAKVFAARVDQNLLGQCDIWVALYDLRASDQARPRHARAGCAADALRATLSRTVCGVLAPAPATAADCMAQAEFQWVERRLEAYRKTKLAGGPGKLVELERRLGEQALELKSAFARVAGLGSPRWATAAACQTGAIYDAFAETLARGYAAGATRRSQEQAVVEAVDEKLRPLRDTARQHYQSCLAMVKGAAQQSRYTEQARQRLEALAARTR